MVFLNVVIYKVFIFFGLFYINMEILKKKDFFLEIWNIFINGYIYVGVINIINCYDIIWKWGMNFWFSLFSKFVFVFWDFK